ncbi:MAG: cAMP receptor protein [Elusimicrobia bacterium ADurb.Bin231]|nr:MAG: cAMP receptor protein [Elusimicrobia bacterium ADurb.Bin231]
MVSDDSCFEKISLLTYFPKTAGKYIKKIFKYKKYPANSLILTQNASGDNLYIVISGLVKIYRSSETGAVKKTLVILKNDEFFGEMALFGHSCRSASAVAVTDVEVLTCRKNDFLKVLAKYPHACFLIISLLVSRLREADKQISALSFQNALGRVIMILSDLSEKYGVKKSSGCAIELDLTHQDLAELAGTAREVVTKIVSNLKKTGCIKISGKRITVTNMRKMKRWLY